MKSLPAYSLGLAASLALLVTACAGQAPADTPEARAEQARIVVGLEISGGVLDETLDLGADLAYEQSAQTLALELRRELTEQERERVQAVLRSALAEILTRERFEDALVAVYAAHFTPAELKLAADFYRSPVGTKILATQATVTDEVGKATEAIVEERLDEFIRTVDERLAREFPELAGGETQ